MKFILLLFLVAAVSARLPSREDLDLLASRHHSQVILPPLGSLARLASPENLDRIPSGNSGARLPDWPKIPFTVMDCYSPVEKDCKPAGLGGYLVWTWDVTENRCARAVAHGGCTPTKNNFGKFQQCWHIAGPVCHNRSPTGLIHNF
uniref:Uncharacterized protein LOC114343957 n=1 Tax=Diabrotica virgifera virgifera TaxID=50390 RepID=A0A6P7GYU2_DIAVI